MSPPPRPETAGRDDLDLLVDAAHSAAAALPSALVTVLASTGSTPRHPPAKMIVRSDGTASGTIGGGRLEAEIMEAAAAVASGASPLRLHRATRDFGMCCGGALDLWIEPLDAARADALMEVARRLARRLPTALATSLTAPGGKQALVEDPCLEIRRPRLEGDCFVEPVLPRDRLLLFGNGHVARALAGLAAGTGFEVVVCDDDVDYVLASVGPFGRGDHAIIATRDHDLDQAVLDQLLPRRELASIGMLGSQRKRERFRARVESRFGRDLGDADWARLRCPVGIDIGAETPEEIAVSIVAELVRIRRGA
jgi:xanthine dehydrogenase accessory factor